MTDLEAVIYGALMHHSKPKTVSDFERAARTVAEMLERRQSDELERLRAQVAPAGMMMAPRDVLQRCRDTAMLWTIQGRIPECGQFGGIAQDLDAILDVSPAAPAQQAGQAPAPAPDDKALTQALEERDAASDYIDALLDEVLGKDRHEWTSNYGHADAMAEVRQRMATVEGLEKAAEAGFPVVARWTKNAKEGAPRARVWVQFEDGGAEVEFASAIQAPAVQAGPVRYPHPDEDDAVTLWAEIHRLRAAVQGPDGYASWQEAATAERVRRVAAEKALAAVAAPALWQSRLRIRGQDNNWSEWRDCSEAAAQDCVRCRDEQWEYEVRALAVVAVQQSKPPVQTKEPTHD